MGRDGMALKCAMVLMRKDSGGQPEVEPNEAVRVIKNMGSVFKSSLPLTGCVSLGKLLSLSVSQFHHL